MNSEIIQNQEQKSFVTYHCQTNHKNSFYPHLHCSKIVQGEKADMASAVKYISSPNNHKESYNICLYGKTNTHTHTHLL